MAAQHHAAAPSVLPNTRMQRRIGEKRSKTHVLMLEQFRNWKKKKTKNPILIVMKMEIEKRNGGIKGKKIKGCTVQLLPTCWLMLSLLLSRDWQLPASSPQFLYWAMMSCDKEYLFSQVWSAVLAMSPPVFCPPGCWQSLEKWKVLDLQ